MSLQRDVLTVIKRQQLWQPEDRLILAISGGVDSMCLLDILDQTQRSHKGRLQVVTFDHGVRSESREESMFVDAFCRERKIPCDIHRLQLQKNVNFQELARMRRREILESYTGWIVTGHHASDQAETILFRLLRGSGLDGLGGMRGKQGRWVKPLLHVFKPELLSYAKERGLHWFEDPSNPDSTRGEIRSLWGALSVVRPQPERVLAKTAIQLAEDADFIDVAVSDIFPKVVDETTLRLPVFEELHPAIQSRVLQRWLWKQGIEVSRTQIELLRQWKPHQNKAGFQLSGGQYIQLQHDRWVLCSSL